MMQVPGSRAARRGLARLALALAVVAGGAAAPALANHNPGAWIPTPPDFNGDGFADLAVGAPRDSVGTAAEAGVVNVIYGSATGLAADGDQVLRQGAFGVPDAAETGDHFGRALATGDFDQDGFSDLAIGAPHEDIGGQADAGVVVVLYGSPGGLAAVGAQRWQEGAGGIWDTAISGDQFGFALAAGDFSGDGHDDLVVGAPFEDIGARTDAGAVFLLLGGADALTPTGGMWWQGRVLGTAEAGDRFGFALAAGNFGNSFQEDLAVGVPGEDVGSVADAGQVNIVNGSASGFGLSGRVLIQGYDFNAGTAEQGDQFGFVVASADFGKSVHADLAVGIPSEDKEAGSDPDPNAGMVQVFYGTSTGLSGADDQMWNQEAAGTGSMEDNDHFGLALAAVDLGKTAHADLAIGIPDEDQERTWAVDLSNVGAVSILYGSPAGISSTGARGIDQNTSGVPGDNESNDRFGSALTGGNYGKGGRGDLAIGIPGEDLNDGWDVDSSITDAGMVDVLYGSEGGAGGAGSQEWTQNSSGIEDSGESHDGFGGALG